MKKAVIGVTQLITALVSIHSSMTFLADMYSFLDPSGRKVLFSVDDRSLFPVNCVIVFLTLYNMLYNINVVNRSCASRATVGSATIGTNIVNFLQQVI